MNTDHPFDFDLDRIPTGLLGHAHEAIANRSARRLLGLMDNTTTLAFVDDNVEPLLIHGMYEHAFLLGYGGTRTNLAGWPVDVLHELIAYGDWERYRELGDPLPDGDTLTLYRGVSGEGEMRRPNGISWTDSIDVAAWFAMRFADTLGSPAVYTVEAKREWVATKIDDRDESEYIVTLPGIAQPELAPMTPDEMRMRWQQRNQSNQAQWASRG